MSTKNRLDIRLHEIYPNVSRAQLQRFIKSGKVSVNNNIQTKLGFTVALTDKIALGNEALIKPKAPSLKIPILYEDDDCIVIEKSSGLLTHSKGAYNPEATVATWLAERLNVHAADREGVVHRLDRGTSGVMIVAKHELARKWLQKQFSDRKVKKTYIARVEGALEPQEAKIDLPIERNPKQPQRFRVGRNGKPSQTLYKILKILGTKNDENDSIVELKPLSGRTHQLRVHLKYMKHPIVGDTFYGGRSAERLYLHAAELELTLPNRDRKTFSSKVPREFYAAS